MTTMKHQHRPTWLQPLLLLGVIAALAILGPLPTVRSQDTDQFTYNSEGSSSSSNNVYAPKNWNKVGCNNLESCVGWPDKFEAAIDWKLSQNDCRHCSADGNGCGTHHQSPINVERNRAINESQWHNQCIDSHWMKYYDSTCTWEELVRLNAFSIERHALKIKQPIEEYEGAWQNACEGPNGGHAFGRIDFSKGFSQWWRLSHTNFHVPSEHTQEGKRYDVEMQLNHFYSVSAEEAGVANQMASLSIFMHAYDDAPDYDMLNKLICQWRKVEDETRDQCGLPSVKSYYPGCFYYRRGHDDSSGGGGGTRNLRKSTPKSKSAHDVMVEKSERALASLNSTDPWSLKIKDDFEEPDIDWDEFIRDVYAQEDARSHGRHLIDYDHIGPWHNYFGMLGVKTEYYFRYSGTQTIPPCYGVFTPGNNRANTNHWRIMKDPIRVSERQVDELHRLLKDRIAPSDSPVRSCKADTAAAPYEGNANRVNVSRPLMMTDKAHFMTFCECRWKSKWVEDQAWCKSNDENQMSRLYDSPYNFPTDGF